MSSEPRDEAEREAQVVAQHEAQLEAQRQRRLAEVFGDVLPETTSDERDADVAGDDSARDAWIRDQVPPHHG